MTQPGSVSPVAPFGYPDDLVVDLAVSDGRRVHVRPILPGDAPAVADAIASADAETLRLRFLGWKPVLDDATLSHLVEVDYRTRLALIAFDQNGQGVGIGRYEGSEDNDEAEIAVAVSPGWRRIGLGTALLELLGGAAARNGIHRFRALYLPDNDEVVGLIRASTLPHRGTVIRGVAEVVLELP